MTSTAGAATRQLYDQEGKPCECGCGEITNARALEARRLRANGWTNVEIAESWGCTPDWVKKLLSKAEPARYIKGHYNPTQRVPGGEFRNCERCGNRVYRGPTNQSRFCQQRWCVAKATGGVNAAIDEYLERRKGERLGRLADFYVRRRLRKQQQEERRQARAVDAARALKRRQARERRRLYNSPEFRKLAQRANDELQQQDQESIIEWLAEQDPEVRAFIEDAKDKMSWDLSLDVPIARDSRTTFVDRLVTPSHMPRVPHLIEWDDPVADLALLAVEQYEDASEWDLLE